MMFHDGYQELHVGDEWLVRPKDKGLAAALVKIVLTEVNKRTVRIDVQGPQWALASGGYYEPGKDFTFVERVRNGEPVPDELAERRRAAEALSK